MAKPPAMPPAIPSAAPAPPPSSAGPILHSLTPSQLAQQSQLAKTQNENRNKMIQRHNSELSNLRSMYQQQNLSVSPSGETQRSQDAQLRSMSNVHFQQLRDLDNTHAQKMTALHSTFRKQNAAAEYAGIRVATIPNPTAGTIVPTIPRTAVARPAPTTSLPPKPVASSPTPMELSSSASSKMNTNSIAAPADEGHHIVSSATSSAFLEKLSKGLSDFWTNQLQQMKGLGTTVQQTEQDFKNHNDLPLARIKRIMKSDEDVRMISAEAPVLFAKACEMFILELTLRSWSYSENNKRRTLQKEDIREAIQRTDVFDFLVDVIH